jgi:hypothetical protein
MFGKQQFIGKVDGLISDSYDLLKVKFEKSNK